MLASWSSEGEGREPLVSAITVCKNSVGTLDAALRSVAVQENVDGLLEHIVIDGASVDDTLAVVTRYPHVRWVSEPDTGIADAFNKGIELSRGRIIGFVHSDDRLSNPTSVKKIIDAFEQHPTAGAVVGRISVDGVIRSETESLFRRGVRRVVDVLPGGRLFGEFMPHPAMYIRRSVYDELGLYDTSFRIAMDYEFILRMRKAGVNVARIDDVIYEMSSGGVSNTMHRRAAAEALRACRLHKIPLPICVARYVNTVATRMVRNAGRVKR